MITVDLECANAHRFEGCFKDYQAYRDQHDRTMISCPVCGSQSVKRLFTGCSINTGSGHDLPSERSHATLFDVIRAYYRYVTSNFDYVGRDFTDLARAIHYRVEKERNIYGESSTGDIQELHEEGIDIIPLVDIDKIEN
jgi:hypothetical protein